MVRTDLGNEIWVEGPVGTFVEVQISFDAIRV